MAVISKYILDDLYSRTVSAALRPETQIALFSKNVKNNTILLRLNQLI